MTHMPALPILLLTLIRLTALLAVLLAVSRCSVCLLPTNQVPCLTVTVGRQQESQGHAA